jgi:hypothetical protein
MVFVHIGSKYKVDEQLTIQITDKTADYIKFDQYINGKYSSSQKMNKENFNANSSVLVQL